MKLHKFLELRQTSQKTDMILNEFGSLRAEFDDLKKNVNSFDDRYASATNGLVKNNSELHSNLTDRMDQLAEKFDDMIDRIDKCILSINERIEVVEASVAEYVANSTPRLQNSLLDDLSRKLENLEKDVLGLKNYRPQTEELQKQTSARAFTRTESVAKLDISKIGTKK